MDRIPKLDLIKELSSISDIHSVDLQFISKKNEDFHRQNINRTKNAQIFGKNKLPIRINPDYNPIEIKGLDPILGDIIFDAEEIPIIRGGWRDRNEIYYSPDIEGNQLKSVNIINKGVVDSKKRTTER